MKETYVSSLPPVYISQMQRDAAYKPFDPETVFGTVQMRRDSVYCDRPLGVIQNVGKIGNYELLKEAFLHASQGGENMVEGVLFLLEIAYKNERQANQRPLVSYSQFEENVFLDNLLSYNRKEEYRQLTKGVLDVRVSLFAMSQEGLSAAFKARYELLCDSVIDKINYRLKYVRGRCLPNDLLLRVGFNHPLEEGLVVATIVYHIVAMERHGIFPMIDASRRSMSANFYDALHAYWGVPVIFEFSERQ